MSQNPIKAADLPRDLAAPFDRRRFLRMAAAAGLTACCPGFDRSARADTAADRAADQRARDKLLKTIPRMPNQPYAVVENMDFANATSMDMPRLKSFLQQREFMHQNHVEFFVAMANGGKIAKRDKATGNLDPARGPIVWVGADGLPPRRDDGYFLSIRKTGSASIGRIEQGNPTKPHAILDKSLTKSRLKEVNDSMDDLLARIKGNAMARLRAADPHEAAPRGTRLAPTMAALLRGNGAMQVANLTPFVKKFCATYLADDSPYFGLVGWWVTVELLSGNGWIRDVAAPTKEKPKNTITYKVPLGFLRLGDMRNGMAISPKGVPVSFLDSPANNPASRRDGYTGDYDLHDAYLGTTAGGANRRTFVSSPYTDVVTATFERQPGETEYDIFTRLLNWSIHRTRTAEGNRPPIFDGYANLVQHGAQNTHFAFITELCNKKKSGELSKDEEEDLVERLAAWDDEIALFANDGLVYTFTGIKKVWEPLERLHQMYNLANCNIISGQQTWSTNQLMDRIGKFDCET
jgi:hypothetical protein